MRELNRLGVTGAIDAGGGFQNYPEDYAVIEKLAAEGQLTVRIAYNLFTQKPKGEKDDFLNWTKTSKYQQGTIISATTAAARCWSSPLPISRISANPVPTCRRKWKASSKRWCASWPRTAGRGGCTPPTTRRSRARSTSSSGSTRTSRSTACTGSSITPRRFPIESIDRIAALGGGIAVQHRMAYQGEYFVERYGIGAAEATPPIARMLEAGIPVSAGTDATRVASYNPWVSLSWLVTGKTVGGLRLYPARNRLDRETALRMWTENVTWFSNEEGKKGRIEVGQFADLVVPDRDYFACSEDEIADIAAALTIVGGKVVYGAGEFAALDETAPPPAMPDWSPVRRFGGYAAWGDRSGARTGRGAAVACRRLRLREPLRHPRPRPRRRPVGTAAGQRSEILLGRARLQLLRLLRGAQMST